MICPMLKQLATDRRGSSSVEFLFGVLFVAVLLIGFLEMGRAIHYYQVLSDGARSGGRYLTRVANPCTQPEVKAAVGLAVTRSADWSRPPIFGDWPGESSFPASLTNYSFAFAGDPDFEIKVEGCDSGAIASNNWDQKVILFVRYKYRDYLGLLAFLGLQEGFWIVGRHEERHIGL